MERLYKKYLFIIIIFVLLCGFSSTPKVNVLEFPEVQFTPNDRILVLAPHPDDEVLGCAGIIQKAKANNLPVKIVFFTYGDNNEWAFFWYKKHPVVIPQAIRNMGLTRHDEAVEAAKVLGISKDDLIFLGYPDFKTLTIWYSHWARRPAARGMLSNSRAVPYPNAFRPGAPYKGEEILKDLKTVLSDFKPTKIFLSHPADHNPDHRALYLFCRVALWDLENQIKPQIFPYLVHFKKWPSPMGYYPAKTLDPPLFLPKEISWLIDILSQKDVSLKYQALKAHKTEVSFNPDFLNAFVRVNELFGDFPEVNLLRGKTSEYVLLDAEAQYHNTDEELNEKQRAALVGIEERFVQIKDGSLIYRIKFSRPILRTATEVCLRIFGYRYDRPFEKMPKLYIKIGTVKYGVYDQNHKISPRYVKVKRSPAQVLITIPLKVIGNPDYILFSSYTFLTRISLDWSCWYVLNLSSKNSEVKAEENNE